MQDNKLLNTLAVARLWKHAVYTQDVNQSHFDDAERKLKPVKLKYALIVEGQIQKFQSQQFSYIPLCIFYCINNFVIHAVKCYSTYHLELLCRWKMPFCFFWWWQDRQFFSYKLVCLFLDRNKMGNTPQTLRRKLISNYYKHINTQINANYHEWSTATMGPRQIIFLISPSSSKQTQILQTITPLQHSDAANIRDLFLNAGTSVGQGRKNKKNYLFLSSDWQGTELIRTQLLKEKMERCGLPRKKREMAVHLICQTTEFFRYVCPRALTGLCPATVSPKEQLFVLLY